MNTMPPTDDRREPAPHISFIIPVRPGALEPPAVQSIKQLAYPQEAIEIILVEGENPSLQRNEGIRQASGEYLYLVDDDSELSPRAVRFALETFTEANNPTLVCVGGPVLTKHSDGPFQKAVGAAMGSIFGLGPNRHRHVPYGLVRYTSESELISANMVLRPAAFDHNTGFDEGIYPNEENELLKRLRYQGMTCMYHPLMVVFRSRRRTLPQVARQNFWYGFGRMLHLFRNARLVDYVLLAPLGLIASIIVPLLLPRWYMALPVLFYAVLGTVASLFIALVMRHKVRTFLYLLAIFPTMHIAYGFGLLWGLIRKALGIKPRKLRRRIQVHHLQQFR